MSQVFCDGQVNRSKDLDYLSFDNIAGRALESIPVLVR